MRKFQSLDVRLESFFSQLFSFLFISLTRREKWPKMDQEQVESRFWMSSQMVMDYMAPMLSKEVLVKWLCSFLSRLMVQERLRLKASMSNYFGYSQPFMILVALLLVWATHSGERLPIMLKFLFQNFKHRISSFSMLFSCCSYEFLFAIPSISSLCGISSMVLLYFLHFFLYLSKQFSISFSCIFSPSESSVSCVLRSYSSLLIFERLSISTSDSLRFLLAMNNFQLRVGSLWCMLMELWLWVSSLRK